MVLIKKILKKLKKQFTLEKIVPIKVPVLEGHYLNNHVAFITGGTGGIGFAIAKRFSENGCKVIISGTNEQRLKCASEQIENSSFVVLDMMDIDHMANDLENELNKILDGEKIDILVNCAGTHGKSDFWTTTPEDWDMVMNVNLKGMYFMCQYFASYMRKNQIKGHILNISSASALKPGKTPYEISKNGVRSMTLGLAAELIRYGIVVNCLAPGPTATKMIQKEEDSLNWSANPTGRVATVDEIANWAVLLVSHMGDYVVGDSFYVTGGSGTICIDK